MTMLSVDCIYARVRQIKESLFDTRGIVAVFNGREHLLFSLNPTSTPFSTTNFQDSYFGFAQHNQLSQLKLRLRSAQATFKTHDSLIAADAEVLKTKF